MLEIHKKIRVVKEKSSTEISTFSLLAFREIVPCECFIFL